MGSIERLVAGYYQQDLRKGARQQHLARLGRSNNQLMFKGPSQFVSVRRDLTRSKGKNEVCTDLSPFPDPIKDIESAF